MTDVDDNTKPVHQREFDLPVDEHGKATRIKIYSIKRPHMRAFHFAWLSFFLAFFGWFALSPLLKNITGKNEETMGWFKGGNKVRNQNIVAVAGTILMRFTIGPVCDRFGPRISQSLLLGIFSIPVFLVGTASSYATWTTARFFIGFIGASFVVTQFWTSVMFSGNIVGTANATSAGWGNLGGGVTQAVMPQINKLMQKATGGNNDRAWRLAMIWPGVALVITAISLYLLSDDLPQGNFADLHKAGTKERTNPLKAFARAAVNWRSWLLFALYAACFGVELLMNANLAFYFADEPFNLDEGKAGLVAALFGLMNLFARSLGGIFSDIFAAKFGMRGRLWAFFIIELVEGALFVAFSQIKVLGAAIPVLICFSLFVQMAEGATFGIVPFVDPAVTGAISGIVGAGGNAGAVFGGFLINSDKDGGISEGFRNIGIIVMGLSFLVFFLWWPQYGSMLTKPTLTIKMVDDVDVNDDKESSAKV